MKDARARWDALPGTVRGAVWMVLAGFFFTAMLGVVKPASANLHPLAVAFYRHAITLFLMVPVFLRSGLPLPRRESLGLVGLRGLLGFIATACWFYAVPNVPLADSTAINFTAPLWATIFATLILGEKVRARRWSATVVGFLGVLVVLRPGFVEIPVHLFVVLTGAAAWGVQHVVLRRLSQRESVSVILACHAVILCTFALGPALYFWTTPSWADAAWIVVLGVLGTLGHMCLARSFAAAEASAVLPFDYTKMPVAALIGFYAYGEALDAYTFTGAAMILGASVYIARREAQLARAAKRDAPPLRSDPPGTA